jgi:hypothetical protein
MATEFHSLRSAAVNYAELRESLKREYGLADDDQALIDTLDGMSDLKDMLIWGARRVKELEAQSAGLKDYIGQLKTRLDRIDGAAERLREQMAVAMMEGNTGPIKDAAVSLSARIGPRRVVISDELALPNGYLKAKTTYTPDKDAIRAELEAGRPVAGAQLSNGQPMLTLRVK